MSQRIAIYLSVLAPLGFLSIGLFVFVHAFEVGNSAGGASSNVVAGEQCTFSASLFLGSQRDEVKCLQTYLNRTGFILAESGPGSRGAETTYFGPLTKNAVERFQAAHGVPSTGYFGPLSRAAYRALVFRPLPFPAPSLAPTLSSPPPASLILPPIVESISPAEGRNGDTITIHGRNFTSSGNGVVLRFGVIDQRFENVSSPDGTTLSVVFSAPAVKLPTAAALALLPAATLFSIDAELAAQHLTRDALTRGYTMKNEAELDLFLRSQGKSIKDFYDPYVVLVKNSNGSSSNLKVFFKGLRNINFEQ